MRHCKGATKVGGVAQSAATTEQGEQKLRARQKDGNMLTPGIFVNEFYAGSETVNAGGENDGSRRMAEVDRPSTVPWRQLAVSVRGSCCGEANKTAAVQDDGVWRRCERGRACGEDR